MLCKQHKQKCDRGTPCSNCVRRKAECAYKEAPAKLKLLEDGITSVPSAGKADRDDILGSVPEARLLDANVMLTLTRTLFMNRCPSIPSPWLHWSEYPSDFTTEPAIYRSAFNDFHTLVVSITRRLMQTAIIQATSRLRAQRHRAKKGVLPFVKRRDVLTAIDIVGMKRDGKQRWQGVARRCGVRVYEGGAHRDARRKSRKEVPWAEVEQIMSPDEPLREIVGPETEASESDQSAFKRRAARSGTPLPMDQLVLTDSDSEIILDEEPDNHIAESADPLVGRRQQPQSRDALGKYANVPPTLEAVDVGLNMQTLEQFDQEAARQEEETLWEMLQLQPSERTDKDKREDDADSDDSEDIITEPDGWRTWTSYRAPWEEFETPVPVAKFVANMKQASLVPVAPSKNTRSGATTSAGGSHTSSDEDRPQRRPQAVELRAQDPRAYAALQGQASMAVESDVDMDSSSESEASGIASERDLPAPSIEAVGAEPSSALSLNDMEWDTYMN